MSEKLSGYTIEQLEGEISRRRDRQEGYERVLKMFVEYGMIADQEGFYFETGQFDRCDPPSPYIEKVRMKPFGNVGEVAVFMTADAWEQFLWMVQCKEKSDDPK